MGIGELWLTWVDFVVTLVVELVLLYCGSFCVRMGLKGVCFMFVQGKIVC